MLVARMGEASRRGEERDVEELLGSWGYRTMRVEAPGTLDGGDVVVTDMGAVFVGLSGRTNMHGARRLEEAFPGAEVRRVAVRGVLHLLSAVKYIDGDAFMYLPGHADMGVFMGYRLVEAPRERLGLNLMYLGDGVALVARGAAGLREALRGEGLSTVEVDVSEFWKCDGSMTCLSFPLYEPI